MELAVLEEIDQNAHPVGVKIGKGAWKRRARQQGQSGGQGAEVGAVMDCDSIQLIGKMGFSLRDEDYTDKENCQLGKRNKMGQTTQNTCTQMVEVASQN